MAKYNSVPDEKPVIAVTEDELTTLRARVAELERSSLSATSNESNSAYLKGADDMRERVAKWLDELARDFKSSSEVSEYQHHTWLAQCVRNLTPLQEVTK